MKYFFYCGVCKNKKHYVNFTENARGTSHWVNSDIPTIYDENESSVVEVTFPEYEIYIYEDDLVDIITQWIDNSDRAFHKEFGHKEWAGPYTGHLLSKIM